MHRLADIRTQAALSVESKHPEVIRTLIVVMDLDAYLHFLLNKAHLAGVDPENPEAMRDAGLGVSCKTCDDLRLKLKEMMMDVVARS